MALVISLCFGAPSLAQTASVEFNRDIRPILSDNCFRCHGPDEETRKSGLRLDLREEAVKPAKSGAAAILPGIPEKSELLTRVLSADPAVRMPPPKAGKALDKVQTELLRRWILESATYTPHWSYVKPARPPLPPVKHTARVKNEIDRFIFQRLEQQGLSPADEAPRRTLIRRVSLDLIGLPPDPAEVERFVADPTPLAYENLVDRLLARPAFGEHWARWWLDLARYADSAGYADDPPRRIWAYRDYVIRALNQNKSFDRFTLEQLAGDLLEDAGEEEQVATAFHRNTMTNSEGGTDDEEFRNAAVVDRVNTTMSVWMGTSMACAQCHTHKYDPLSQKEYFQLFAILNNTLDADRPDESPLLKLFIDEQKQERREIESELAELRSKLTTPDQSFLAGLPKWEEEYRWLRLAQTGNASFAGVETRETGAILSVPADIAQILSLSPPIRTPAQQRRLREFYQAEIAPELQAERTRSGELTARLNKIEPHTVPVMRELAGPMRRKTQVHVRGNYQQLGDTVEPGVPAVFHPLSRTNLPPRLALAYWLMDSENPLTARVMANRFWEQIFGLGLVRTSEEFGMQGDLPSHPELLDWLATELMARNWDMKSFLKLLLTSATYRQSSRVTPDLLERDPENVWLSRGPRFRMPAEVVRDQALAVSGLLSRKMHGLPVRPPQPSLGLTAAFGGSLDWKESTGEDRHRRSVYIEWRRTNPYPSLTTFDAPNREVCTLKRPRSNTPLQALVTLNDPVFVEAAQGLGRRLAQAPGSLSDRVKLGFQLCLARDPSASELRRVIEFFDGARETFVAQPEEAKQLATVPLGPLPDGIELASAAAWSAVANVLLNLDETLMRP